MRKNNDSHYSKNLDSNVLSDKLLKKDKKSSKKKNNIKWLISIFTTTFILSLIFSFLSTNFISNLPIFPAILFLLLIIFIGVVFDAIGVAVTVADEDDFHAKASKRIPGSKLSIKLIRHAPKVANFCGDVIGDICGVLSGAISALISIKISSSISLPINIEFFISALVAALTVCGKSIGKNIAQNKSGQIVHFMANFLNRFRFRKI